MAKKALQRTRIADLAHNVGQSIRIQGFVDSKRIHKEVLFLTLRDRTGTCQVTVTRNDSLFKTAQHITLESVIAVTGVVDTTKRKKNFYEIIARGVNILSVSDPRLPIPPKKKEKQKETAFNRRIEYRWIDLRAPEKRLVFETWTELERGFRGYYEEKNYLQIYVPSLIQFPIEEGAVLFETKYFKKKALLSQSNFYKQMAMAAGFEKVFSVGPIFRAERSFTTRHLAEFTGWDFELSYIDSHADVMNEMEGMIITAFQQISKKVDIKLKIPKPGFPTISLRQAKKLLKQRKILNHETNDALSPTEEKHIGKILKDQTGHDFLFVTDFPTTVRPYYYMRSENDPSLTKSFDLLYKGIEVCSGAQREHRYDTLKQQAKEFGVDMALVEPYFAYFKFGCPPHGGAGIGPARIIMALLGLRSVKEAVFLPRDVTHLTP